MHFNCSTCHAALVGRAEHAGKQVRCPRCKSVQLAAQGQPAPPVAAIPKSAPSTQPQQDDLHVRRDRFGIAQLLMLVAGIAVAFWVTGPLFQVEYDSDDGPIGMIPVILRWSSVCWMWGTPLMGL